MKTTYTYRLYQFENGLGQTVWQAKQPLAFGIWVWLRHEWIFESELYQWNDREVALKWLREHSQKQLDEDNAHCRAAKRAQLKLIVIEPVKINL